MNTPAELTSFPQMVDMIFGTFESGSINLKMLHAFLHALMSQLPLDNVRVRLAGDGLDEVRQKMDRRPKADVRISEYWLNGEEAAGNLRRVKRGRAKKVDKMVVVKQLTEEEEGDEDERTDLEESGSMEVLLLGDVDEMQSQHLLALDEILNGAQAVDSERECCRKGFISKLTVQNTHFLYFPKLLRCTWSPWPSILSRWTTSRPSRTNSPNP
jgi:hypothetical protein